MVIVENQKQDEKNAVSAGEVKQMIASALAAALPKPVDRSAVRAAWRKQEARIARGNGRSRMLRESVEVEHAVSLHEVTAGKTVDVHRERGMFFEVNAGDDERVDADGEGVNRWWRGQVVAEHWAEGHKMRVMESRNPSHVEELAADRYVSLAKAREEVQREVALLLTKWGEEEEEEAAEQEHRAQGLAVNGCVPPASSQPVGEGDGQARWVELESATLISEAISDSSHRSTGNNSPRSAFILRQLEELSQEVTNNRGEVGDAAANNHNVIQQDSERDLTNETYFSIPSRA